jgi:hypothetical protein
MNAPSGQNAVSQAMAHFANVAMRGRLDGLRVGRRRRPTPAAHNAPRSWLALVRKSAESPLIGHPLVVRNRSECSEHGALHKITANDDVGDPVRKSGAQANSRLSSLSV